VVDVKGQWRNRPLFKLVIDEIARHGGRITDQELYRVLREEYGLDVSMPELHKILLVLELRGFIVVSKVRREFSIMFSRYFIKGMH